MVMLAMGGVLAGTSLAYDCNAINAITDHRSWWRRDQQIDQPPQQQSDRPHRGRGPAVAPRLRAADIGDRLWRQHQAVAGDGVELLRQHGAAREQFRRTAEEAADLDRAFRGILDHAHGAEIALD